jgi:mono/diheme cytochrome c family protein
MPRRRFTVFFLLRALAAGWAAPGADREPGAPPAPPTFDKDILPLFQAKCVRCHGDKMHKADLDLRTLAGAMKGGESGAAIVPGKPDESLLFEKVHGGAMPPGKKDGLSDGEVNAIRLWIAAGAKAGAATSTTVEPAITQHDVIPILLRHCTVCHGPHRQHAGLDLRTKAAMLRGGKSGPAIVPSKPDESRVIQICRAGQMPPRERLVEASVKPIEPAEIDTLAKWIAAGAPEIAVAPDVATTTPDPLVTDKDRDFWAFQPVRRVSNPSIESKQAPRVRNPIDAFISQKLEQKGLSLSPEADRLTLIRRAYFDLTGLPPDPAAVQAFVSDPAADAYEKIIDRLLASPRYGERWGRYWLDLAGYADSEGKREQDLPRPHAWRYRDYVIRSLNNDKPYDRFLLEQLAGDELADYEHAPEITQELYDNLVATGFLRMAPDATWANITGYAPDRVEVIADEIDVLGSAVIGLTLKCARCHTHKFDPIPHRDYYRLVDIFKGAFDEYDWLKPDVRPGLGPVSWDVLSGRLLPYVTTAERREWESHNTDVQRQTDAIRLPLDQKAAALSTRVLDERFAKLPDVLRADLRKMLATPADRRDAVQKYLAEKFEQQLRIDRNVLKAIDPAFKAESADAEARIAALRAKKLPEPKIQALWDRGEPTPTYIYRRGDSLSPGRLVGPGVPTVLTDGKTPFDVKPPWPGANKTGRRLAFAQWLTKPDHPLTARVAVNRLWKHHFGSGIVKTLGNFGKTGTPPTHPELLDWLAQEFVHKGWSLKAMHRLMMTSATYRQSSAVMPDHERLDPDSALLARMPLTRLDAESLYDAMLFVADRFDGRQFGPADDVQTRADGLVTPTGTAQGWRRLIYVRQTRKQIPTHLENFDFPQMNPNCVERRDSTVAPQALHLMNNGMVQQIAEAFARRVMHEAGSDPAKQIERVFLIALSRLPSEEEIKIGQDALGKLAANWTKNTADKDAAGTKALTTLCHAMVNSAGFLYVD